MTNIHTDKIRQILLVITMFFLLSPLITYALDVPTTYTPLAPLPTIGTSSSLTLATTVDFQSYVTYAFNLLIAIAAVMAVFMITVGGFQYMTSDAVQGKKDGLEKIKNAIYGLILVLSSYLILKTIDPRFVSIPTSLVTPLELNQKVTVPNAWETTLTNMEAEAAKNSIEAANANNNAKFAVEQLQNELNTAQNELVIACGSYTYSSTNANTPECVAAEAKVADLQDMLNSATSNQLVTAYQYNSAGLLHMLNSGSEKSTGWFTSDTKTLDSVTPALADQALKNNNNNYYSMLGGIQANGSDPTAIQTLDTLHIVTQSKLQAVYNYVQARDTGDYGRAITNIQSAKVNLIKALANNPTEMNAAVTILNGYIDAILKKQQCASCITL
jgi:hypothetical protein